MRWLGTALFAEGPTDHRFLRPLLRRTCEDLCARRGRRPVEIAEVQELHSPARVRDHDREIRILEAARDSWGAWHVLFVHADGAGDPERAKAELVAPAAKRIAEELGAGGTVAVIPVRESEAWALADGDALRRAFGCRVDDAALGLPRRRRAVEGIADPKRALERAYLAAAPRGQRGGGGAAAFLDLLGEHVSLEGLREVPAFRNLYRELGDALCALGFLNGEGG